MAKISEIITVNESATWYSDKKLQELLELYASANHIGILQAIDSYVQLKYQLERFQQSLQFDKPQCIIPLNVNALTGELDKDTNHWVGLYIIVGSNNSSVEVNYVNTMGFPISHNVERIIESQLKQSFTSVLIKQPLLDQPIQYIEKKLGGIKLSGNTDDCGPLLVYAMACLTRALKPVRINDKAESVSLGFYLRESFDNKKDFNSIYHTINKSGNSQASANVNFASTDSNEEKKTINEKIIEAELPIQIGEQHSAEIEKLITEQEKKLFPNLHKDSSGQLPEPEKEKEKALEQIQQAYGIALQHYQEGNLDKAEEEFAKVLRPVLSKPRMKNLYVNTEEVKEQALEAMHHLGLICLITGKYLNHHAKAAAIFQYCAKFAAKYQISNPEEFLEKAYSTEEEFLESIGITIVDDMVENFARYQEKVSKYKQELYRARERIGEEYIKIKDWRIEEIPNRAEEVRALQDDNNKFFVNNGNDPEQKPGFVQQLLKDCFKQLGSPPEGCQYSIIGLGSLAGGRITPWSDLEFAILINEDKPEYKEYFRNLTKLLHIKVINLGETPLRSVGAESLNNFRAAEAKDEWFWDELSDNGFSFDGPDWYALKSPLGRQGGYKAKKKVKLDNGTEEEKVIIKQDFELIHTPEQMAKFQLEQPIEGDPEQENWFQSDIYLVQGLRLVTLIDGSQELLDNYRQQARSIETRTVTQGRALKKLEEDVVSFSLKVGDDEEGKLIDVKKDIFRIGDRIIDDLANYFDIWPDEGQPGITAWQVIDKMASGKEGEAILSKEGAGHLKEALGIATELRLVTYYNNKGQKEGFSTYEPAVEHLSEKQKKKLLEETFYIKDTSILHHFYYVMLRIQNLVKKFCGTEVKEPAEIALKSDIIFDDSNYAKGMVHARFLEYDRALKYMIFAKNENPENLELLRHLYFLYNKTGKVEEAIGISKEILELRKEEYKENLSHSVLGESYNNLGIAYDNKGEYDQAIDCYYQALKIFRKAHEHNQNHFTIARGYNNLGVAYYNKGEYDLAINYYNQALEVNLAIYAHNQNHIDIGVNYSNLGSAYDSKGDSEQAIKYYHQALEIDLRVYEYSPNHPNIAGSYNNLGKAYFHSKEYEQAIKYFLQALSIRLNVYKHNPYHPDIADSYRSLSASYVNTHDYEQAINYCKQALEIDLKVYEYSPNHPNIAGIYKNLSGVYSRKGEYDLAVKYCKQALEIYHKAYESSPAHPNIISCYNMLGAVYLKKGKYEPAIECYNKILEINPQASKHSITHSVIAEIYNDWGDTHYNRGEYKDAIRYYSRALEIWLKVWEKSPSNTGIADSYNNLGNAYYKVDEYDQAIDFYLQALKVYSKAHEDNPNYLNIAGSYNNIGNVYASKGEYDQAIDNYKRALEIRLKEHVQSPYPPDIVNSYKNLGLVYSQKEEYEQAYFYFKNALEVIDVLQSQPDTLEVKALYELILVQLGNTALLENDIDKAGEYFGQVNNADFYSREFINLQFQQIGVAYECKILQIAITCQKVLVTLDPELKFGNHYHNLACFYACKGNLIEAKKAFIQAFKNSRAEVTSELYAECAQFLILNKDNIELDVNPEEISNYLYSALSNDNINGLQYGKIEENNVCPIIQTLIKQKNSTIQLNPKILAYYLLITNPEYILKDNNTDNLLQSFRDYCDSLQDEISFTLLSNACTFIGNEELALKYLQHIKLIGQIDAIIAGKINPDVDKVDIDFKSAQEFANNLHMLALKGIANEKLEDASRFLTKVFQIYRSVLIDQPDSLRLAADNLATFCLLTNNLNQFVTLKLHYKAGVNPDLVNLFGQDINTIKKIEQKVEILLQMSKWQENIQDLTSFTEDPNAELSTIGEGDEGNARESI